MARDAYVVLRDGLAELAADLYQETMQRLSSVTVELHPAVFLDVVRNAPKRGVMVVYDQTEKRNPTYTFDVMGVTVTALCSAPLPPADPNYVEPVV